ncbi:phosphatase PAP2 family protein [Aquibacillus saliphilus]|uniref:phosphatase PAP2 family protein n=1 Tax=Aquibacillus saliphilus TaxID=1909422 RepID=UPI001CEFCD35|nr:phosphatase PAP2 family protein [Aquibacillus saliphilus]
MKTSYRKYFAVSVFILAVGVSIFLTIRVIDKEMPIIDEWSSPAVAGINDSILFEIFRWLTELGSGTFLTPFSIAFGIFLWFYSKDWIAAFMLPIGTMIGYKINYWIKLFVARERPRIFAEAEGVGFSFPSGHAMVALIAYGMVIYFLINYTKSRRVSLWINVGGLILILLIGASRYVIRVHYLTDVVAGYAFGLIFLMIWIVVYQLLISFKSRIIYFRSPS